MLAIVFAFAVVNILLEKVLNEGMNPLVLITYRQLISILFIAPIAYFRERYNVESFYHFLAKCNSHDVMCLGLLQE